MNLIKLIFRPGSIQEFTRTHSKTAGPITSKEAVKNLDKFAKGHFDLILTSLKTLGPKTAKEVALVSGLTSVQVSRRVNDLFVAGLIYYTGIQRNGCREFAYKLSERA